MPPVEPLDVQIGSDDVLLATGMVIAVLGDQIIVQVCSIARLTFVRHAHILQLFAVPFDPVKEFYFPS